MQINHDGVTIVWSSENPTAIHPLASALSSILTLSPWSFQVINRLHLDSLQLLGDRQQPLVEPHSPVPIPKAD